MIVYKYDSNCYHCGRNVTYFTYLVFYEYDFDVTFPLDMDMVIRIYAEMPSHRDDPYFDDTSSALNYPIKVLGDDEYLDSIILKSRKFPQISIVKSSQVHKPYAANHCPHCNAFLGNYYLREQITDRYLRPKHSMKKHIEL